MGVSLWWGFGAGLLLEEVGGAGQLGVRVSPPAVKDNICALPVAPA